MPIITNAKTLESTIIGFPTITALIPDRPAARAGLRVGDERLSLDGVDRTSGKRFVFGPPAGTRA